MLSSYFFYLKVAVVIKIVIDMTFGLPDMSHGKGVEYDSRQEEESPSRRIPSIHGTSC
jgi:hypothetical protein